jgi:transcriptional/translational regulatory protein YebC/TACO1
MLVVDGSRYSEDDLLPAIEAGAEDVGIDEDLYEITTEPADFTAVREALDAANVELESADLTMRPTSRVEVPEQQAGSLLRLIEALEDHDDVAAVHANFDLDAAVLERVAAA